MTSERGFDRAVEELVDAAVESGARSYSPHWNRIAFTPDATHDDVLAIDAAERAARRNPSTDCRCYPRGVQSMSREDREEIKRIHIEAGVHRMFCPMWVDPDPLFSRRGDALPSSYSTSQRRRDQVWPSEG